MSEHVPIPISVLDAGLISTDFEIGELGQTITGTYALSLNATNSTEFTVETLTETISEQADLIQLDGEVLNWQAAGDQRPDVYTATVNIDAGTHQLTFSEVPQQGTTFSVAKTNIDYDAIPFRQGVHAGCRLLLANPVSNSEEIEISTIDDLSVVFNTLSGYVVLDLGRTVHGRLLVEFAGPSGTVIDIGWDERLLKDTKRPLPYPGSLHPQWNQVDSWILDGNSRSISTLDTRAGRYLLISAWGKGPVQPEYPDL